MNYVVLCGSSKEAYDLFLETTMKLSKVTVGFKNKKIIFDGDIYSFEASSFFERYGRRGLHCQTLSSTYFYEKWIE